MKNLGKIIALGASALMCSAVMLSPATSSTELSAYAIELSEMTDADIVAAMNSYFANAEALSQYKVADDFSIVSKETGEATGYKCEVNKETGAVKVIDADELVIAEFNVADVEAPAATTTTEATTTATTETTTETTATTETTETTATTLATTAATTSAKTTSTQKPTTTTQKPATTSTASTTKNGTDSPKTGVEGAGVAMAVLGASLAVAFVAHKKED